MISFHRILFIIALLALFSCQATQEVPDKQEKKAMTEIFPGLIDSLWVEINFSMRPPPVREVYDSSRRQYTYETGKKDQAYRNEVMEALRNNRGAPGSITLVIDDSIHTIGRENVSYIQQQFQAVQVDFEKELNKRGYQCDLSLYKADTVFNLVYASAFKPEKHDRSREHILSTISFSRILFDQDKTVGVLTAEYHCGLQCGIAYRIYIKKLNGKWVIEKVEEAWIA